MFGSAKKLRQELTRLRLSVESLTVALQEGFREAAGGESIGTRVAELEHRLEAYAAKAEGLLVKADSRFAAARAAEERERAIAKRNAPEGEGDEAFTEDELRALAQWLGAGAPDVDDEGPVTRDGDPPVGDMANLMELRRQRRGA